MVKALPIHTALTFAQPPSTVVWHPCCRPPVAVTPAGLLMRNLALTTRVCSALSGGP